MDSKQIALDFAAAINQHDVKRIFSLMSEDHVFIDAYGDRENKKQMESGWAGYFKWFPDYKIEIETILYDGNVVAFFGFAGGSYHGRGKDVWRIPAAWKVVTDEDRVKVWQVFADSKIPFEIIVKAER